LRSFGDRRGFVYDAAMHDQMLPRKPIEKITQEPEKKEE